MYLIAFVRPQPNFMLEVLFVDGLHKVVDCRPYIGRQLSDALYDEIEFRQVVVNRAGYLAWPSGDQLTPEFIHDKVPGVALSAS